MSSPRRVAIIGAGPSGLSAVSQLVYLNQSSSTIPKFSITLFERRSTFGGVWNYDASPGPCIIRFDARGRPHALWQGGFKDGDDKGRFRPPGAMYDGLRTNLPCDIMGYRSQPYDVSTDLFPDRATVERYIRNFAKTVLDGNETKVDVRLGTAVNSIRRIQFDAEQAKERIGWGSIWKVTSINVESQKEKEDVKEEEYDHIVIASGRCNTPTIPAIPGLDRFTGEMLHSAWWRSPIPFEGKTVLVVGNSSSGSDIARELSGYLLRTLPEGSTATEEYIQRRIHSSSKAKILHSYQEYDKPPPLDYDPRDQNSPDWAKRIQVVPKIKAVKSMDGGGRRSKICFEDGQERDDVDVIIFATGYAYDLPYLDQALPPFAQSPLIPACLETAALAKDQTEGEIYTPPYPTASYLTNLDDWSLFYSRDASICVLGAPMRIVPIPITHVQSRIIAAAWSGNLSPFPDSNGLPKLDSDIPTTDPTKWSSRSPIHGLQKINKTADLGYPSDTAYQEALLQLLPQHLKHSGTDQDLKIPPPPSPSPQLNNTTTTNNQDVQQSLRPVVAKDEGWAKMPHYRNQRRSDTKRLRRLLLGY
ncbi:related to FMO1 - flavin-containing monooxygenase [Ustilago trichophora]|uniref:Related to FMO1 - flavin-containing monooxygenase n=1 Tax=Ustilago trichophora TaxID=86804 RepID=A0A5C3DTQ5_9BASI|nr:related to FMO1 - flavin-containing monooxygenase [Ustilago trichophora]